MTTANLSVALVSRAALIGVVLVTTLTGCVQGSAGSAGTPTATSAPTSTVPTTSVPTSTAPPSTPVATGAPVAPAVRPALAELTITPQGIGSLFVGEPVPDEPADTAIVTWNPTYCVEEPATPNEPYAGAWQTTYPAAPIAFGEDTRDPFSVVTSDGLQSGTIHWINVWGSELSTEAGVSAGDTRAALESAYPSFDEVIEGDIADVYVIRAPEGGELWFEVANGDSSMEGYWGADVVDRVIWIRVMPAGYTPGSMAGGDGGGPCAT
jgi:hypothetical protein